MIDLLHLTAGRAEVLQVEVPGEIWLQLCDPEVNSTLPLMFPSVTNCVVLPEHRPGYSPVISVQLFNNLYQAQPENPFCEMLEPYVAEADERGYTHLVITAC